MAIHALITGALALATPTAQPIATNDNAALAGTVWTQDPRAVLLLASCAALPPVGQWHRTTYVITADEHFAYVGYRAEALEAIRMEHGDRALAAYRQQGESAYPAFSAWCSQPNATGAIDAALTAVREA